jgi:hypothetical protein
MNTILQSTDNSYGLASVISFCCPNCIDAANTDARKRISSVTLELHQRAADKYNTKSELCQYDINVRFCLVLQLMGIGGEQAHILTLLLDLPEAHKRPRQFSVLEKFLHPATELVKCVSQEEAAREEIIQTDTPDSYIPQYLVEDAIPHFRVEASYDMGWQVRSSGGKYGSSTGHGLLIGALSKKVMDSVVKSQKIKQHACVKNYEGSSKSIEASALTKMLIRIPEEKRVSICTIITDDDSNGWLKSYYVANGGVLPPNVEEPAFHADPPHRKRVVARAIYNLSSLAMKKSAVTKGLVAHIKYCYGAWVKRNRHQTAEELSVMVQNILQHICGCHDSCNFIWCYDKKTAEKNLPFNPPADHRLDKVKYAETYNQLQEIFNLYASVDIM